MRRLPLQGVLALLVGLAGCDRPGPLSAAVRGKQSPPPAAPAWAAGLQGKALADAFPRTVQCVSAVDAVTERYQGARRVVGWAWNTTRSQPIERLAIVDAAGRMVGFGEGGGDRPDVPAAVPQVRSRQTGWWAVSPTVEPRYAVYGLDTATASACRLGEVKP